MQKRTYSKIKLFRDRDQKPLLIIRSPGISLFEVAQSGRLLPREIKADCELRATPSSFA
jgi:hypothetical protein